MQKAIWVGLILLFSSPAWALEVAVTAVATSQEADEGGQAQDESGAEADAPEKDGEGSGEESADEAKEGAESTEAPATETPATEAPVAETSADETLEAKPKAEEVPASAETSQAAPKPPVVEPKKKEVKTVAVVPAVTQAPAKEAFDIKFGGYLRVHASTISADRFLGASLGATEGNNPWMGRSDGFSLGDARLNMRATYGNNLYVRLGFDGALSSYEDSTSPVGSLSTGLKDAYLRYTFSGSTQVFVGRFKPPFDIEELTSTKDQQFVHSALESRGVAPSEGNYERGRAPGRQLGVMVSDPALIAMGGMDLGYALALTNGNSGDATHNDNDLPAIFGRMSLSWGTTLSAGDEEGPATQGNFSDGGSLGFSGYVNQRTTGTPPTRFSDMLVGAGVDLSLSYSDIFFRGQALWELEDHKDYPTAGAVQALGGHAAAGYRFTDLGIELA
ncbi:MAG: porin, partial [Myxococcota bacterium]|nr:porin [Myxococcota bacterium]